MVYSRSLALLALSCAALFSSQNVSANHLSNVTSTSSSPAAQVDTTTSVSQESAVEYVESSTSSSEAPVDAATSSIAATLISAELSSTSSEAVPEASTAAAAATSSEEVTPSTAELSPPLPVSSSTAGFIIPNNNPLNDVNEADGNNGFVSSTGFDAPLIDQTLATVPYSSLSLQAGFFTNIRDTQGSLDPSLPNGITGPNCPFPKGFRTAITLIRLTLTLDGETTERNVPIIPYYNALGVQNNMYYGYYAGPGTISFTPLAISAGATFRIRLNGQKDNAGIYSYLNVGQPFTGQLIPGTNLIEFDVLQAACAGDNIEEYTITLYPQGPASSSTGAPQLPSSSSSTGDVAPEISSSSSATPVVPSSSSSTGGANPTPESSSTGVVSPCPPPAKLDRLMVVFSPDTVPAEGETSVFLSPELKSGGNAFQLARGADSPTGTVFVTVGQATDNAIITISVNGGSPIVVAGGSATSFPATAGTNTVRIVLTLPGDCGQTIYTLILTQEVVPPPEVPPPTVPQPSSSTGAPVPELPSSSTAAPELPSSSATPVVPSSSATPVAPSSTAAASSATPVVPSSSTGVDAEVQSSSTAAPEVPQPSSATPEVPQPSSATPEVPQPSSATPEVPQPSSATPEVPQPSSATPEVPQPSSATPQVPQPSSATPQVPQPSSATPEVPPPTPSTGGQSEVPSSTGSAVVVPPPTEPETPITVIPPPPQPPTGGSEQPPPETPTPETPTPETPTPEVPPPTTPETGGEEVTPPTPATGGNNAGCPYPSGLVFLENFKLTLQPTGSQSAADLQLAQAYNPAVSFYQAYTGDVATGEIVFTPGAITCGATFRVRFNHGTFQYIQSGESVKFQKMFGSNLIEYDVIQAECAGDVIQEYAITIYQGVPSADQPIYNAPVNTDNGVPQSFEACPAVDPAFSGSGAAPNTLPFNAPEGSVSGALPTFCEKYSKALFGYSNSSCYQESLISAIVHRTYVGNSDIEGLANSTLYASIFAGWSQEKIDSVTAGAVQYLGAAFGCDAPQFPAYTGPQNLTAVFEPLKINAAQYEAFTTTMNKVLKSFGVSEADIVTVVKPLLNSFLKGSSQEICQADDCPIAMGAQPLSKGTTFSGALSGGQEQDNTPSSAATVSASLAIAVSAIVALVL